MFKGLKNHSTLYVLHHSTPLGALDPLEVVDILKMRPRIPTRSSLLSPPPQFSRGTTPLKQETSPLLSPLGGPPHHHYSALMESGLKPEQERDIAIFKSFCAMKLVLDAIWCSVQLRNGVVPTLPRESSEREMTLSGEGNEASNTEGRTGTSGKQSKKEPRGKAARKLDLGSADLKEAVLVDAEDEEEMLSERYRRGVAEPLQDARMFLGSIYPLNYRLEVLENIFSLLLLTSDDIKRKGVAAGIPFTRSDLGKGNASSFIGLVKGKREFLMDEKLASSLLDILQDSIRELRAAKYALSQQDASMTTGEKSTPSANLVKCSVPEAMLKLRTTKLEQYVNEARWRLQMVSPKHGIVSAQSRGGGVVVGGGVRDDSATSSGEDSVCLSDSDEGEPSSAKERKRRSKRSGHGTAAVSVASADESERSVSSRSSSRATVRSSSAISHTSSRPPSIGRKVSPGPTVAPRTSSPSGLSTTQLAPRPASFAGSHSYSGSHIGSTPHPSRSHSTRSSPKGKSLTKQNSTPSSITSSRKLSLENSTNSHNASNISISSQWKKAQLEGDSGGEADVEERSPAMPTKRRKRLKSRECHMTNRRSHAHHHHHPLSGDQCHPRVSRDNIICWMLASAGSLLRMCLKHSNYMRATEVLKTLHMEGQFGEALIRFSEQYEAVSRQLVLQSRSTTPQIRRSPASASSSKTHSAHPSHSNTPPQPPSTTGTPLGDQSPQLPSNMNLQVAILNAKSSFDPLQCVYQLLAPSSVYQVLFSGDTRLEELARESEPLQRMMAHVPSLVMLDLVCSNKVSGRIATKLLEVASDRLQSDQSVSQDTDGPFVLLRLMASVSTHFPQSATNLMHTHTLVPPSHLSPHSLLTRSCHALTPHAISQVRVFEETYRQARERLEAEMDASREELGAIVASGNADVFSQLLQLVALSNESPPSASPPPVPRSGMVSPLRHQTPPTASIFDELIRALHSVPSDHTVRPSSRESGSMLLSPTHLEAAALGGSSRISYLWQFSRYISRLVELIIKCLNAKASSEPIINFPPDFLLCPPNNLIGPLLIPGIPPLLLHPCVRML